jgi:hypothetical protein
MVQKYRHARERAGERALKRQWYYISKRARERALKMLEREP